MDMPASEFFRLIVPLQGQVYTCPRVYKMRIRCEKGMRYNC